MRKRQILPLIVGLSVVGLSLWDCSDPAGPADGTVAISTSTVGDDPDADGFQVTIDGLDSLALLPSGTVQRDLTPGRHTLQLVGVAENCSVTPGTSVEVDITAGSTTPVAFQVSCPLLGITWGKVLGEGVGCIRGAMVEIVAGPGLGRTSGQPDTCDPWNEDGFWFYDLPLGATVTLRATASGYQSEDRDVVVPRGGEAVVFVLQRAAP